MANDTSAKPSKAKQSLEEKAQAKAAKLAERNKALAAEEQKAWQELHARADKQIQAYRGRPRFKWTEELEQELFNRLSNGQSLAFICELDHMPSPATVYERIEESPSFALAYTRARENMGSVLLDQCLRIADDDSRDLIPSPDPEGGLVVNHAAIQRDKMRIDTRMRMAGKYNLRLADKPPSMDGANITVNNNTLQLDARELDGSQRDSLRQLLIAARDKAGQG